MNVIKAVVNFAAESHVDRSIENSEDFIKTNVLGVQVLLEAARRDWQLGTDESGYPVFQQDCLFIQISTDEVYGARAKEDPADEQARLLPSNPYAASKAAADLLVSSYFKTYHLPAIITRCSNNYGIHQYPEKLIPLAITKLMQGQNIPLYGNGEQIRDWIHVEDHVVAIEQVRRKGKSGEIYNISACCHLSYLELIMKLILFMGIEENRITFVKDRLGHDACYAMNSNKLTARTGWKPSKDMEESLKEVINSILINP